MLETQVYDGSGYDRIQYSTRVYDEDGHVTHVYNSNGTHMETSWGCCNKESETNAQGITTLYPDYDDLGRLLTSVKEGETPYPDIYTTYTYDAVGRTLTQTVNGAGLSLTTSTNYDAAGRLDNRTDPAGLVTDYAYSANGRIDTVIHPGGAVEITERHVDGRTKSITGTGVVPRFYTYGVNPDGTQWTQVNIGNADSPMWEKTTTDMLGRTLTIEKPGSQGIETTSHFYNNLGQLEKTSTTGQADTLYAYDALGNQVRTGLDVDAGGTLIAASNDRITESESAYTLINGNWWQETISKVYAVENTGTVTTVGTQRTQISGLGTGGMVQKSVSEDIHGNQTLSQTTIDRANKTETRTIDYPDSNITGVSQTVNGLLMSTTGKTGITLTYAYDALGRRTMVTDPRTGDAETHYNNKGQVDYVEDAAGNRTSFTYESDTGRKATETNADNKVTRYLYNAQGRVTHTWGDAAYPVLYEYDPYGRMEKMHTFQEGTSWNLAMWPTGDTGPADITTWHYQEATGLLEAKEYADGSSVTYSYEPAGRLDIRTWARPNGANPLETDYDYDPATGELTDIDYSDATPDVAFTYDRLGRQKTVTDGMGSRTFFYNPSLQPESETITGLYDRVITRTYETGGVTGRPTGFTLNSDYSVTYGYESNGRFGSISWDAGGSSQTVTYDYVPDSELLYQLTTDNGQSTTFAYEPNRNLKTQAKNVFNGQLISRYDYQYDALGRRSSALNSGQAFAATTDAFNLYNYNDRNELIESTRYIGANIVDTSNPVPEEYRNYDYDPIGNRIQAAEVSLTNTYASNAVNQYEQITTDDGQPPENLFYDEDGNLTEATLCGKQRILTYNAENRLIAMEPETPAEEDKKLEFLYDYMGRRVQKTVYTYASGSWIPSSDSLFLYDGWNLIEERTTQNSGLKTSYYVWGLDLSQTLQGAGGIGGLIAAIEPVDPEIPALDLDEDDDIDGMDLNIVASDPGLVDLALFAEYLGRTDFSTPAVHYYQYDANGNVGQMVNAEEGSIAAHYEYDPFGNVVSTSGRYADGNPFRFSTKYADDETGLVYYGYRYYSPELGRWINRDPIEEDGGLNLYAFVENNGINSYDSLGLRERRRWRNANFWRGWNLSLFDERGEELLGRWLDGSQQTLNVSNGNWGRYMMANRLLRPQLAAKLESDAKFRTSSGNITWRPFPAVIENGYTTGYEMLHGTESTVGHFQMEGAATVSKDRLGNKIKYQIKYTWNDIIDPNPKYGLDMFFAGALELLYSPADYVVHISWNADSEIVACNYKIISKKGYPFN